MIFVPYTRESPAEERIGQVGEVGKGRKVGENPKSQSKGDDAGREIPKSTPSEVPGGEAKVACVDHAKDEFANSFNLRQSIQSSQHKEEPLRSF